MGGAYSATIAPFNADRRRPLLAHQPTPQTDVIQSANACHATTLPHETPAPLRAALKAASKTWADLLGPRLISLVLFGSVARGDARESSDIDLLVVADRLPRSLTERARPLRQAWERLRIERGLPPVEWNLVVKTPDEATHHRRVVGGVRG